MSDKSKKSRAGERRVPVVWVILAVVLAASLAVGACALWLPDRAPALLGAASEVTSAPVNVQQYDGVQQVTMLPTVAAKRDLTGNVSGIVTGDWSEKGLASGKKAYKVNDRAVIALATSAPLYRDMKTGDTGDDVLALNNELARLGYSAAAQSNTYTWATAQGVTKLLADNGNTSSSGDLPIADVLWIPSASVQPVSWTATPGATVQAGTAVGQVPGALTKLTIMNGQASDQDRTISMFGQTGVIPAGQTAVTDAKFCNAVAATEDYRSFDEAALSAGLSATVSLKQPVRVLRVPAAAVFGVNGTQGCIAVPKNTSASGASDASGVSNASGTSGTSGATGGGADSAAANYDVVKVTITGSELGASLVQTDGVDAATISNVAIGSAIANESCR